MPGVDILIGNNLPLYREVLASTLRVARPDLTIQAVLPSELDDEVLRARPCLVICSVVSETIVEHCPAWIHLFPDQRDEAIVMVGGECKAITQAGIRDLVDVLEGLAQGGGHSPERGMST
jgi:hypothetical protein